MKRIKKTKSSLIAFAAFAALALLPFAAPAWWIPGLRVGTVSSSTNYTDWPAVTNTTLRLDAAETMESGPSVYSFWAEKITYVYWGQMYFQEGTYNFAKSLDDMAYVSIDGNEVLKNANWSGREARSVTMTEGWHDVVFRFGNGNGGAGPYVGNGWTATKGFGYNVNGKCSTNGDDYELLFDTGDGSFFSYDDGKGFGEVAATVSERGDSATLSADLTGLGASAPTLTFYYGTTDGGSDATAWDASVVVAEGLEEIGLQSVVVEGLSADTTYFFRARAVNDNDEIWSEAVTFATIGEPALGEASLVATSPTAAEFSLSLTHGTFAWLGVEVREQLGGGGYPNQDGVLRRRNAFDGRRWADGGRDLRVERGREQRLRRRAQRDGDVHDPERGAGSPERIGRRVV